MFFKKKETDIPCTVPPKAHKKFIKNYETITKKTGRLLLFAADQKLEHLAHDFYGKNIHPDAQNPEQLFRIAEHHQWGAMAAHLGLIARYGNRYNKTPYVVKLNGKTDLISTTQQEPLSEQLWNIADAVRLKEEASLPICGVGYTIYLGSAFETTMLAQAAQIIAEAHAHGLITVLWIYPRGAAIVNDQEPLLIAGCAGAGASLGADFVKIKSPEATERKTSAEWLALAAQLAGNTQIICAGGAQQNPESFLTQIYEQISIGNSAGIAVGRNIFQRSLPEAHALSNALAAIIYENKTAQEAIALYKKQYK